MNLANIIEVTRFTDLNNAIRITFRTTKMAPSGPIDLYKAGQVPQIYETVADVLLPSSVVDYLMAQLKEASSSLIKPTTEDTLKVIK